MADLRGFGTHGNEPAGPNGQVAYHTIASTMQQDDSLTLCLRPPSPYMVLYSYIAEHC
jgi:hypothetical protein